MGFVVEGTDWSDGNGEGEPSFSAFVFESNTEGEKVRPPIMWFEKVHYCWKNTGSSVFLCLLTDLLHYKSGEGHHRSQEGNKSTGNGTDYSEKSKRFIFNFIEIIVK